MSRAEGSPRCRRSEWRPEGCTLQNGAGDRSVADRIWDELEAEVVANESPLPCPVCSRSFLPTAGRSAGGPIWCTRCWDDAVVAGQTALEAEGDPTEAPGSLSSGELSRLSPVTPAEEE